MSTSTKKKSDARICRERSWMPGTRLAGDEGYGVTVIQITAVGERSILARAISHKGQPVSRRETVWTLACRDWYQV